MMIMIEVEPNRPVPGRMIGRFKSIVGGYPFRRYWWRCVAISFWFGGDLKDYGDALRYCEWIGGRE